MRLIREILRERKKRPKNAEYFQIKLNDEDALKVFGSCVFDQLRKQWIVDDYQVVWLRELGNIHAKELIKLGINFEFDFDSYDYTFLTSVDE